MTTTVYEIPLTPEAQSFTIAMAGVTYNMRLMFNNYNQTWVMDISDSNSNPLLMGLPLVTGVNLLLPYTDLGFGGSLTATTDHNPDQPPTYSNLGSTGHVYFTVTS